MRPLRAVLHAAPLAAALACGSSGSPGDPSPTPRPTPCARPTQPWAASVVETWIPASSLEQNIYNNPEEALGPPNAGGSGPSRFTGFVSLGFGGHVTVDLGGCIADQPGNDLRIWQAVSGEPLSVYVSAAPDGPFALLLPFFQECGTRHPSGGPRGYCEFDLAGSNVSQVRYVRVEDAEIYPCPCGTPSEGADLDAVQALSVSSAFP